MSRSDVLILPGAFDKEFTYNTILSFIKTRAKDLPDAFLAGNDSSAIGCIEALVREGYQVPEDVSVMGFDDIDIAKFYKPPLTTIRNPISQQGMLAVKTLVNLVNEQEEGKLKRLEGTLVVRNSCIPRLERI